MANTPSLSWGLSFVNILLSLPVDTGSSGVYSPPNNKVCAFHP